MAKVLVCWGTRPEKLKLEPVMRALKAHAFDVATFETVQSPDLLKEPKGAGGVVWRSLSVGVSSCLQNLRLLLQSERPDLLLVQGDTATAFSCALGGFLEGIPVGHVEAGMRTYAEEPHPEEAFRRMIAALAKWHFAPDEEAALNVVSEVTGSRTVHATEEHLRKHGVFITGNTLYDVLPKPVIGVLATLHRRENWGDRIERALDQLNEVALSDWKPTVLCVTHPNWKKALPEGAVPEERWPGITFAEPMPHEELLYAVRSAAVVVTDSGGLQEEAAFYGTPCIVFRTATERVALQRAGAVRLVDPDETGALVDAISGQLAPRRIYGVGDASQRIAEILRKELGENG